MEALYVDKYAIKLMDTKTEKEKADSDYTSKLRINSVTDEVINVILKKDESKRTDEELQLIVLRKSIDDEYNEKIAEINSYIEFVPCTIGDDVAELDDYTFYYEKTDTQVLQKYTVMKNSVNKINNKIAELKQELSDSDYKIIKIYESKIAGTDCGYTEDEQTKIYSDRQTLRDKINELEELLN
jgi:hypothetical protein